MWRDQVLVFFENEVYYAFPDTGPVYLAPVGTGSHKSIASGPQETYWFERKVGFYSYNGASVSPISRNRIDPALVDLSLPHESICDGDHYIFYCTYESVPSLLIFDILLRSWVVRKIQGIVDDLPVPLTLHGLGYDADSAVYWGVTAAGELVRLFDGETIWTDDAATGVPLFDLQTADWPIAGPGRDGVVNNLLVEAAGSKDTILEVTVTARSKKHSSRSGPKVDINMIDDCEQYERPIALDAVACNVQLQMVAAPSNAPTVYGVALTTQDGNNR
jgi:hypothetical protein